MLFLILLPYYIAIIILTLISQHIVFLGNFFTWFSYFYVVFAILAAAIAYLFYCSIFWISEAISRLAIYHISKIRYEYGETFRKRALNVFLCYMVLAPSAYITAIYIMQPSDNEMIYAFIVALIFTIAYLISLRIISNPTKKGLLRFWILDLFIVPEQKDLIRKSLKERVSSFYFALTEATIFYFSIKFLFRSLVEKEIINPFGKFLPAMSGEFLLMFIAAFLVALAVATVYGELLLAYLEPIEQL